MSRQSQNTLSAIFFDFDGTLRHSIPPWIETFHDLAAELGVKASSTLRLAAERWIHEYWAESEELHQDLENFGRWEDNLAFWNHHARRHLMKLGASEKLATKKAPAITQMMREQYQSSDHLKPDVLPTLRTFRQAGYILGVISNRNRSFDDLIKQLGLEEYFDFTLAAGEVGWYKPDPRLLLHAAEAARVKPAEVAYVGDSYYADIPAARSAGMTPILIDPKGLFPEAECQVISALGELPALLNGRT